MTILITTTSKSEDIIDGVSIVLDTEDKIFKFLNNDRGVLDYVLTAVENGQEIIVDSRFDEDTRENMEHLGIPLEMLAVKYGNMVTTVDVVPFAIKDGVLCVGLVKRDKWPYPDSLCIPGGFIHLNYEESVDETVIRVISHYDIKARVTEQVETVAGINRDPRGVRGWAMTTLYYTVVNPDIEQRLHFVPVDDIIQGRVSLGFDHGILVEKALKRIRDKSRYSNIPVFFMPQTFTMTDLMKGYAILTQAKFNSASLRRKLEGSGFVVEDKPLEGRRGSPIGLRNVEDKVVLLEREVVS